MSLEELDEAFQAGVVNEGTPVRRQGDAAWATLAKVAGIDAPGVSVLDTQEIRAFRPRPRRRVVYGIFATAFVLGGIALFATRMKTAAPAENSAPAVAAAPLPETRLPEAVPPAQPPPVVAPAPKPPEAITPTAAKTKGAPDKILAAPKKKGSRKKG